jgi:4-amino-4-deoxy-L-arabinose transferase-like glycosyltransferase
LSLAPVAVVASITLLGLLIRLVRLDGLPAEMWGDVTAHYFLAQKVLHGHFYLDYEFGGDGPLFSYLAAAVSGLFGLSFYTLKLTSVLAGTLLIVAVYFYADSLLGSRRAAYVASFLAAVSFWSISLSRQGKPYILVPVFVALALTFGIRNRPILAGIVLGLGMYAQAAFWGTPFVFLLMPAALPIAAVVAFPVLHNFAHNPASLLGSGSYLGSKLHTAPSPLEKVLTILDNFVKNLLSFNLRGDETFRQNIPGNPHLDYISGALFLVGMVLLIRRAVRQRDTRLLCWFLVPFVVLQIPMVLDQVPTDSPNLGRLACLLPITLTAIACALVWLAEWTCRVLSRRIRQPALGASLGVGAVLAGILAINMVNYFEVYPQTLPNHNTAFDLAIAQRISDTPKSVASIVVGCCWAEAGQPESDAIWYRTAADRRPIMAATLSEAKGVIDGFPAGRRIALYMDPVTPAPGGLGLRHVRTSVLESNGWQVALLITGQKA